MTFPLLSELKFSRKHAGLTQLQLSKLSGVSQPVIAKIENNQVDPAYSTVVKLFSAMENTTKRVKTVGEVMHVNVATVKPSDAISVASQKMKRLGVSQLPVVTDNELTGLVTEDDILGAIERGLRANTKVEEIAEPAPPTISSSARAAALSSILHHSPIVCVVNKNKLVGVVTRADLLTLF